MKRYSFTVEVTGIDVENRPFERAFYEAGCDDALIAVVDGHLQLDFEREADSFDAAVQAALRDVQKAGGEVQYLRRIT